MSRLVWCRVFQDETFLPFDDDRFDAFEDHGKLGGTDENDACAAAGEGNGESKTTGFEPLIPQSVSVTVPVKDFEPVGRTIDEGPSERICGTAMWQN